VREAASEQGRTVGPPTVMLLPEGERLDPHASAGTLVLTPNPRAARALGVPWRSLERLARDVLRPHGLQPAPALAQWRALRWAVREALAPSDVDGAARAMVDTLKEVLRAGLAADGDPDLAPLAGASARASARLGRVTAVARAYRARLRRRGLADPAEMLWCAARAEEARAEEGGAEEGRAVEGPGGEGPAGEGPAAASPDTARRPLWVLGYPRIGRAEIAFLAAVAGRGSVLALPAAPDPMFQPNREAARALGAYGWAVVDRSGGDAGNGAAVPAAWFAVDAAVAAAPDPSAAGAPQAAAPTEAGAPLSQAPRRAAGERRAARPGAEARPAARGLRFGSREAEVRYALAETKRLLAAGEGADGIVLIARDDADYGPLLQDVAWELEVPVAVSYRVPLRDTRVGGWTALLLEAVREGLPFEAVARLLAHPFGGGLAPAVWEAARLGHPHGLEAWRAVQPGTAALAWPERATRGELLARLHAVWAAFGLSAPPDAAGSAGSAELPLPGPGPTLAAGDALAFQRLAAATAAVGLPASEPVAAATFLHDLDALLTLVGVPAEPEAAMRGGCVELHTPLAVYGARYRHVFVLGAAEGTLPAPVAEDAVLDFAERRLAAARGLPMEGAVDAARREALSFRAVLWTLLGAGAGASLTVSYPEDSGIASPVFAALGIVPSVPGPRPPASDQELRRRRILEPADPAGGEEPVLAAARRAWAVERRREEAARPDGHDGVVGEAYGVAEHVFSATQLLDLGQCPFRWLARVPLRLAEPEEAEEDVTPLLRGRLYHRALELALRRGGAVAGDGAAAAALRREALAALEAAFAEAEVRENAVAVPAWPLRRAHHLEALRRVLAAASFLPDGAEVVALERRFPARGAEPPRWRGFPVAGVVDRVDRRDGRLVLVDYKTRSSPPAGAQDDAGKARLDLQLPLYLEAAAPALFPAEPTGGAQYYSLTKAEVLAEVRPNGERAAELDAFAARARALLEAGRYPVAPDVDFQACRTCDFDLVCRKGPRTERMRGGGAFDAGPRTAGPRTAGPRNAGSRTGGRSGDGEPEA